MSRILSVTPKDDYFIEVALDNGNSVTVGFKSRLHMIRFSILSDKDYFNMVTSDGAFVRWNYKVEISISEIFEMAQK